MDTLTEYMSFLTSSEWVYVIIFILAVAEACALTSYFLSGTIGLVIVGILMANDVLHPVWSVAAVYVGTIIGDVSSFMMSRALQRVAFIASAINRLGSFREVLGNDPARFIILGHFTPYLRALLPVLAAGVVPLHKYLAIEAIAALVGTLFFVGMGYAGAEALAEIELQSALTAVGIVAGCALVGMWIYSRKPFCPLKSKQWLNLRRAIWFYVWYLPWHPVRWTELLLRRSPSRRLRRSLGASFPDVRAGDIFVIRLHAPSPWGRWAHSAIAIDAQNFCHGFASVITAHSIAALPVRYAVAHIRVCCNDATAEAAAEIAHGSIGSPVSIAASRHETRRFSCASLVAHAYRKAGVELVDPAIARIVPNDLFTSQQVELIRIVHTEKVRRQTRQFVFEARKEG